MENTPNNTLNFSSSVSVPHAITFIKIMLLVFALCLGFALQPAKADVTCSTGGATTGSPNAIGFYVDFDTRK